MESVNGLPEMRKDMQVCLREAPGEFCDRDISRYRLWKVCVLGLFSKRRLYRL